VTLQSPFLYTICQVGAEPALKKELARVAPELKFAFSRPGFVTFKKSDGEFGADFHLTSVFARSWGISWGALKSTEPAAIIAAIGEKGIHPKSGKLRLHVWERDQHLPGDEPLGFVQGHRSHELRESLLAVGGGLFETEAQATPGELVVDLIWVESDQLWLGAHEHSSLRSAWPGGRPSIVVPAEAPSRAFLKLEEVIRWAEIPLQAGDTAVEVGSAPGGASWALLERGLSVVGIDPGEMDRRVSRHPRYRHFSVPVNAVRREDLPSRVDWLLLDMNVEPRISLFSVDRLASRMKDSLLGVILTVKLNQWKMADEIPSMVEHVQAMGMVKVRAAQLSYHRQEILIYGLTRKGTLRRS